jgi:hypothetical protein
MGVARKLVDAFANARQKAELKRAGPLRRLS